MIGFFSKFPQAYEKKNRDMDLDIHDTIEEETESSKKSVTTGPMSNIEETLGRIRRERDELGQKLDEQVRDIWV